MSYDGGAPAIGVDYFAPPTVGEFLACDSFIRLIVGPVGSGKSSGCCVEIIRRAIETPPGPDGIRRSRWAVVRNTYGELRDTTIKTFKEWVPESAFGKWHESDYVFEINFETEGGAKVQGEILFRALDRPDHVKKLLSLELTGCYFNETKEIPQAIFDVMQGRVGRYPKKTDVSRYWTGVFGDTNPMDTDHYLYKLFEEDRPIGYKLFKQPSGLGADAENIAHLDRCFDVDAELIGQARELAKLDQHERLAAGEHENPCRCYYLRQMHGKTKEWCDIYLRGMYGYVVDGKAVYPEFNDSIHVTKEIIKLLPNVKEIILGNDYGLTPAAVFIQEDPMDGQLQVIDEFVSIRLGAITFGKEQARILNKDYNGLAVIGWGDPAGMGGSSIDEDISPIDCVNAAGVPMSPAPTNDPTPRRESIGNLLTTLTVTGRPALVISPKCKTLRKGLAGGFNYRRVQVSGDARYEDKPNKNRFSHVCEALEYACVGQGKDYAALDGGQQRKTQVKIRVHRASGAGQARGSSRHEEDEEEYIHVPKVRRRS